MQPEVIKTISYTREELDKLKPDFQDEYCMVIAPRIARLSEYIDPRAIHWFYRENPTDNNNYLRAVFSCFYVGGSGSHYKNWEICYSKFGSKVKFYEFCTGFPIAFSADFFY